MNNKLALERMPHRGSMQLIDDVLHAEADDIECRAKPHDTPDYPLRVDGQLFNTALVELGAQAAAAHASLYGVGTAHVGLLLTLGGVDVGDIPADEIRTPLMVHATRLDGTEASARYRFRVCAQEGEIMLVSGDAILSMQASA